MYEEYDERSFMPLRNVLRNTWTKELARNNLAKFDAAIITPKLVIWIV